MTTSIMNYATWEKDPGCDYHLSLCAVDGTSLPYDSSGKYSDDKYSARRTKA